MYTIGVTTVQRWSSEAVAYTLNSYLLSDDGTFVELAYLHAARGSIVPRIKSEVAPSGFAYGRPVTMQTPVYLCDKSIDLQGKTLDEAGTILLASSTNRQVRWELRDDNYSNDMGEAAPICCG